MEHSIKSSKHNIHNENENENEKKTSKEDLQFEEANFDVPVLPELNVDRDFSIAKRYLQILGEDNESLWDHLVDILRHVLDNRPPNCMKNFEGMSRSLRINRFSANDNYFREVRDEPINLNECTNNLRLYTTMEKLSKSENPFVDDTPCDSSMLFNYRLLSESGIGIPYCELYNIYIHLRALSKLNSFHKVRFWGIIHGIEKKYIIAECDLLPEALSQRIMEYENERKTEILSRMEGSMKKRSTETPIEIVPGSLFQSLDVSKPEMNLENIIGEGESVEMLEKPKTKLDFYVKPPLPLPPLIEKIEVPKEPPGEGVNHKVYYVTNNPGDPWVNLPDVTPKQMVIARQIKRYFTGNLDAEVITYPEFPGTEKELLRAQIARISATTQVSPVGYFEGESEEEGGIQLQEGELFVENLDYQPLPVKELLDNSLEFWAHHTPFILHQGRTSFWSPAPKILGEGEAFAGEDEVEPEIPPRILRPLSQDDLLPSGDLAWSLRTTSNILKESTAVTIRSHLWPGAVTVTRGKDLQFIYVGWGFKDSGIGYSPPDPGAIQAEYEKGPEIMEMDDPTVEMEEEARRRAEAKAFTIPIGEDEMVEEEQGDKESLD